jgi:hypothetical protein
MEHIVQFAVGIDDKAIVDVVMKNAPKEIIDALKQQVADRLFAGYYRYSQHADPNRDPISNFTKGILEEFLNENKDIIIEKAAQNLAERLVRTKKGKEILDDIERK